MSQNKKYDAIIFTDFTDYTIPIKSAGANVIASHLRRHGYSIKIIDNFVYLLEKNKEELFKYMKDHIGPNTLFVGFSTTFMAIFDLERKYNINTSTYVKNQNYFRARMSLNTKDSCVPNFKEFMELLVEKYSHVKIVLGGQGTGTHIFYNAWKDVIDCWIKGLGEDSILKFIENMKNGIESPSVMEDVFAHNSDFYNQEPSFSSEDNVFPNEILPMIVSKGCRFNCKFCSYPLLGRKPSDEYVRSEESLYKEFKQNYDNFGTTQYNMMCDTFNETTDKLLRVQRAIDRVGIKINFWAYIRMDLVHAHPEQLEILKEMGIRSAFFGIESLYDPSAKAIGKGFGREKTIEMLQKMKDSWGDEVLLHGAFIIGLPHETPETANEWCQMLCDKEIPLDSISMNALRIFPNNPTTLAKTSRMFFSEFDLNAEKYGYVRGASNEKLTKYPNIENRALPWQRSDKMVDRKGGWYNEHWSMASAQLFAIMWKRRIAKNSADKLSQTHRTGNTSMSLLNSDYTWKEIMTPRKDKEKEFLDHIKMKKKEMLIEYAGNVFTQ